MKRIVLLMIVISTLFMSCCFADVVFLSPQEEAMKFIFKPLGTYYSHGGGIYFNISEKGFIIKNCIFLLLCLIIITCLRRIIKSKPIKIIIAIIIMAGFTYISALEVTVMMKEKPTVRISNPNSVFEKYNGQSILGTSIYDLFMYVEGFNLNEAYGTIKINYYDGESFQEDIKINHPMTKISGTRRYDVFLEYYDSSSIYNGCVSTVNVIQLDEDGNFPSNGGNELRRIETEIQNKKAEILKAEKQKEYKNRFPIRFYSIVLLIILVFVVVDFIIIPRMKQKIIQTFSYKKSERMPEKKKKAYKIVAFFIIIALTIIICYYLRLIILYLT